MFHNNTLPIYPADSARRGYSLQRHGYRGKEIAAYLRKDDSVITRYSRDKVKLKQAIDAVMEKLKAEKRNVMTP